MKVTPRTEEELQAEGLLPDGNYPFEVVTATDKLSAAGNEMIELNLRFYGADGRPVFVKDWLMEKMGFKLRHFCEETNLIAKYEAGELKDSDCEGKQGFATLKKEAPKPKKDAPGEFFPAKNSVKDYGKKDEKPQDDANAKLASASVKKDPDDDLPTWD